MRKAVDGSAVSIMVVLCLIWAMQQIALKGAAEYMAPALQVALRSGVVAVLIFVIHRCWLHDTWLPGVFGRSGLVVGSLFGLEFLLIAEALRYTSTSHVVVFLYTAPIFVAIGLHGFLPDERLNRLQWIGISLAFAGIALAFLWPAFSGAVPASDAHPLSWLGDVFALAAGALWGGTTIVLRTTKLKTAPVTQVLFCQMWLTFVIVLAFVLWTGQTTITPSATLGLSMLFQIVLVSLLSYFIWFWLLERYLAARLGVLTFMTPIFGLVLGAWLLDERVEKSFLLGACLVLVGVFLVNGQSWLQKKVWSKSQRNL